MKILLIRLQILLIILVVFSPLLYLGYRRFTPQINLFKYDLSHKNISYPPISPLHTEGTQILNAQNKPVLLRGVNLISTNWGADYQDWNPRAIDLAAQDWHVNVVRTRLYQHAFEANPAQFFLDFETQILEPARENGLYVILHPWFGDNQSLPDNVGVMMWLSVAKRYKNDSHIIYDLLAEPRDITFAQLKNTYTTLIPQLRIISPNSLIMVTGLDWGRDVNAWLEDPLPYANIVYRSNPYNTTTEFPGYFGRIAEKYPVFLGEFGTDNKLSMTENDVRNLLGYADALNLGWTAWHFTSSGCPCLLADEVNFVPTPYGQLIKNSLAGEKISFTPPSFDPDPSRLYVYSDFLESGFANYSWGITNQFGVKISTQFHPGAGFYLNTSRRINPRDYQTFHFTLNTLKPGNFYLRFKSYDNQLSQNFPLVNGANIISTSDINLESLSGIILETQGNLPDPTPITLDQIYFQK